MWYPHRADAFILDWDGVIADSRLDFREYKHRFFGRADLPVPILELIPTLTPHEQESARAELDRIEYEGAVSATRADGAEELLSFLSESNIPYAVVTRNSRHSTGECIKKLGFDIPILITRDDAPPKPDPYPFLKACEMMSVSPVKTCSIGDFYYDLLSARRAGVRAILVNRKDVHWSSWSDVSFDRLIDFVCFMKDKKGFIPWEYAKIADMVGRDRWAISSGKNILIPSGPIPRMLKSFILASTLGVKKIYIDSAYAEDETPPDLFCRPEFIGMYAFSAKPLRDLIVGISKFYPLVNIEWNDPEVELTPGMFYFPEDIAESFIEKGNLEYHMKLLAERLAAFCIK